jgi:hypothetical protein
LKKGYANNLVFNFGVRQICGNLLPDYSVLEIPHRNGLDFGLRLVFEFGDSAFSSTKSNFTTPIKD